MRSQHPIFTKFPLDERVVIDGEELTSPYHVYDGTMLLVGGTADAAAAAGLLAGERLAPLLDDAGRALAAVWLCDFTDANLGPHHELQISLFASFQPVPPLKAHPFAIFRALTALPQTRMVCHGLWNSTRRVVRFNSEHLGLDTHLSLSEIERPANAWRFQVRDEAGAPIVEGELGATAKQSPSVLLQVMGQVGVRGMLASARSRFVEVPVVNTRNRFAADNLVASTHACSDRQVIRRWSTQDRLAIRHPRYAALGFAPAFVQQLDGVRFVYQRPRPEGDAAAPVAAVGPR